VSFTVPRFLRRHHQASRHQGEDLCRRPAVQWEWSRLHCLCSWYSDRQGTAVSISADSSKIRCLFLGKEEITAAAASQSCPRGSTAPTPSQHATAQSPPCSPRVVPSLPTRLQCPLSRGSIPSETVPSRLRRSTPAVPKYNHLLNFLSRLTTCLIQNINENIIYFVTTYFIIIYIF
jgi:hypothetical protein